MPPLSTRVSRTPTKDPLTATLEELDAPFKSTQEAKRKKIILALALLFFLDLIFFLGTHSAKVPVASPGKPGHLSFQPARCEQANLSRSATGQRAVAPDYFQRLALDRASLAARQDKLELENNYLASLQANLSPSQRQDLKAMRDFRQEDLALQEEKISKLSAELKALSPSQNQAPF